MLMADDEKKRNLEFSGSSSTFLTFLSSQPFAAFEAGQI